MAMPAIRRRWTTTEVRALNAAEPRHWPRYELIDGELLVTPAPSGPHQTAVDEIVFVLATYVRRDDQARTLTSPADLELQSGTITQPDAFVIPLGADPGEGAPGWTWADLKRLYLAVEVISPSSIRTDRIVKRDLYMSSDVAEYWIVDLDARMIERWTPTRETPDVRRDTLEWLPPGATSPLTIDVPALFERIWSTYRRLMSR
jgi:Uma2 family endonuclease